MSKPALTRAARWAVASRVAAAVVGAYALTAAATALLAWLWPAPKAEAVLVATMLSFTLYTVAVIWVFTTRSALRAWAGMLIGTALLSAAVWLLKMGGAT